MFIGREHELKFLHDLWNKKRSILVTCTGRRRIGKSTLIKEFAKHEQMNFIEFQGIAPTIDTTKATQLKHFSTQLSKQFQLPALPLTDWYSAFDLLNSQIKTDTLLFIDEISWLAHGDSDFPGLLKNAWDNCFKMHKHLMIVMCGSVSTWIEENILNSTAFVGRISAKILLEELPINKAKYFWGSKKQLISNYEKTKILMVLGGIPRYLEEINPAISAEDNIKTLCFEREGLLFGEFDNIFYDSLHRKTDLYLKILKLIVQNKLSFQEICAGLKVEKNGSISKYLNDLNLAGFISKDFSYNFAGEISKTSRYRICDNYTRFYIKYILPNKDKIKKNIFKYQTLDQILHWNIIAGFQFENLLLNNLEQLVNKLAINPQIILAASPYFQKKTTKNKGACQIDLLIQTKFSCWYVCEFKFKKKISLNIIDEVKKKIEIISKPKHVSIQPILIYAGELDEEIIQQDFFAALVSIDDLFADS